MEEKDDDLMDTSEDESLGKKQVKHLFLLSQTDKFLSKRMLFQIVMRGYYHQLSNGCSNRICSNKYCGRNIKQSARELAQLAVMLSKKTFENEFHFCDGPNPVFPNVSFMNATGLSLSCIESAVESCKTLSDFTYLRNLVGIFSKTDCLNASFETSTDVKVDLRKKPGIDYRGLERVYEIIMVCLFFYVIIFKENGLPIDLRKDLDRCMKEVCRELNKRAKEYAAPYELRKFMIILLNPLLLDCDRGVLGNLINAFIKLSYELRREVFKSWVAVAPKRILSKLVVVVQHFLTMQLYTTERIDERVAYATRALAILNSANEMRPRRDLKVLGEESVPYSLQRLEYTRFYNDAVNTSVDLLFEFKRWVKRRYENIKEFSSFSFLDYSFILDPASKSRVLQIHSKMAQNREVSNALVGTIFSNFRLSPFLVLRVDRHNLVNSALAAIVEQRNELKKPLKVKFLGEEGVDEGGVRKEFFQLIVKQLFNIEFGMFQRVSEETMYWFNLNSTDLSEFRLIGQIVGLAIYNKVILDIHFPLVVYKKLLSCNVDLDDLSTLDPEMADSMHKLLEYEGDDVEEVFFLNFQVDYKGFDGTICQFDLIKDAKNVMVTNKNRQEFVDKYVEWNLSKSIEKQFSAFKQGFHQVVDHEHISFFKPEELELLVCGSPEINFDELQKACKYGDSYNPNKEVIKNFWKVVKSFDLMQKKLFLMFCTGSDRVPIKGLGKMTLIISKNGEDPKRLPTAHTCYNILLLPEYKDIDTLRRNLLTAITHGSVGFGLQ